MPAIPVIIWGGLALFGVGTVTGGSLGVALSNSSKYLVILAVIAFAFVAYKKGWLS